MMGELYEPFDDDYLFPISIAPNIFQNRSNYHVGPRFRLLPAHSIMRKVGSFAFSYLFRIAISHNISIYSSEKIQT